MRSFTAKNARRSFAYLTLLAVILTSQAAPAWAQSSSVYATLCGTTSHITIAQPASDSTVTAAQVTVSGTVAQANQIEVYIDDEFDSTIPLTVGQTTYSGSVQLPNGTHTLRVEAINSCSGQNGEATSVVTYTIPPAQASSGTAAATGVAPAQGGAVTIGPAPTVSQGVGGAPRQEAAMPLGLPPLLGRPLEQALDWLNIAPHDQQSGATGLSLGRAMFVVLGMYFLVLGAAPTLVHTLAGLGVVTRVTPQSNSARRQYLVRWGVRVAGLLVLLLALFL
ncbi:hypothetical protein GII36_00685 [Candidatus Mycosynbacter amalyticus]|uniref:Uncharacterized protein n=1 Tax=Candidatus Mycosynbacter amalyticus TaxID=2665156 RepID=A0A857MKS6_9BACT|nr:Ig-like domain-containing protein [Candidatus Mycosynbacter amalyticus]QHN42375.1 hypothetical protein GII36_00685 [Candidatus Mycosynbacter amalyticus]